MYTAKVFGSCVLSLEMKVVRVESIFAEEVDR